MVLLLLISHIFFMIILVHGLGCGKNLQKVTGHVTDPGLIIKEIICFRSHIRPRILM
jgi:hypothetical protein